MPQVGKAVVTAGVAIAGGVRRTRVIGETGVPKLDVAARREQLTITCVSRRNNTVEHVDATQDGLCNIDRRADAHEIARRVCRHPGHERVEHRESLIFRLTHGKTADRVAVETDRGQSRERRLAQRLEHAALDDAE